MFWGASVAYLAARLLPYVYAYLITVHIFTICFFLTNVSRSISADNLTRLVHFFLAKYYSSCVQARQPVKIVPSTEKDFCGLFSPKDRPAGPGFDWLFGILVTNLGLIWGKLFLSKGHPNQANARSRSQRGWFKFLVCHLLSGCVLHGTGAFPRGSCSASGRAPAAASVPWWHSACHAAEEDWWLFGDPDLPPRLPGGQERQRRG